MSDFKTGSSGDRTYFYYHNLETLKQLLDEAGFEGIAITKVEYRRTENDSEVHTIVTAKKKAAYS